MPGNEEGNCPFIREELAMNTDAEVEGHNGESGWGLCRWLQSASEEAGMGRYQGQHLGKQLGC